jgi:hypothetical protein
MISALRHFKPTNTSRPLYAAVCAISTGGRSQLRGCVIDAGMIGFTGSTHQHSLRLILNCIDSSKSEPIPSKHARLITLKVIHMLYALIPNHMPGGFDTSHCNHRTMHTPHKHIHDFQTCYSGSSAIILTTRFTPNIRHAGLDPVPSVFLFY